MAVVTVNIVQLRPRDCLFEIFRCLNTRELLIFTGVSQTAKDSIQGYNKLPISRWTQLEYCLHTTFGLNRIQERCLSRLIDLGKIPTTLKKSVSQCVFQIGRDFDYKKFDSTWIEDFKQLNTITVHSDYTNILIDTCWLNKIMAVTCAKKIVIPSQCWGNSSLVCFPLQMNELEINFCNLPLNFFDNRIFPSNCTKHTLPVDIILNFSALYFKANDWIRYHLFEFSLRFKSIRKLNLNKLWIFDSSVSLIPCEELSHISLALQWDYILNDLNWPGKKKVYVLLDPTTGFSLKAKSSTITHMYLHICCNGYNSDTSAIEIYHKWVAFLTQVLERKQTIVPNIQYINLVVRYTVTSEKTPKNISTCHTLSGAVLHVTCGYMQNQNFHI